MNFQQLFERLRLLGTTLTPRQLISLGATFLAVVALVVGSAWYLNTPDYRILFTDMEPEEAGRVQSALTAQKVQFTLANGGRDILVPKERVDELRLSFSSSEGLPTSGRIGFEIFDRTAFGQTEFLEQVNYRRALEGEIARTISTISEVSSARVHIAMAKDSLFGSRVQPAKASVVLKLKKNRPLAAGTIAGITNLVAASVEGLRPESVVLIDSFGRPLARANTDGNSEEPLGGLQTERQQRLERELSTRVVSLLEPVVGADRVRVNVNARLNSSTEEQTQETFDPATVIRSRQVTLDGATNGAAQGLAGSRANVPGATPPTPQGEPTKPQAPPQPSVATTQANRSAEIVNYEVSKTVTHTVKPRGDIARLSVAVLVDDEHTSTTDAQGKVTTKTAPRNPAELQKIQQIVAAAVGIDATRGDLLTVENIAFDETVVEVVDPSWSERYMPSIRDTGKMVGIIVIALCALLFVIRPMMKGALAAVPKAPELPAAAAMPQQLPRTIEEVEGEIEAQLDAAVAARVADRKMPVLQRRVLSMAQGEPQNAARLLRSWLAEGRN